MLDWIKNLFKKDPVEGDDLVQKGDELEDLSHEIEELEDLSHEIEELEDTDHEIEELEDLSHEIEELEEDEYIVDDVPEVEFESEEIPESPIDIGADIAYEPSLEETYQSPPLQIISGEIEAFQGDKSLTMTSVPDIDDSLGDISEEGTTDDATELEPTAVNFTTDTIATDEWSSLDSDVGVSLKLTTRVVYDEVTNQVLRGYYRIFTWDSIGALASIGLEGWYEIDTPEDCTDGINGGTY